MTESSINAAIEIINGYIRKHDKPYEMGTDSKEWQRNKRDYDNRITAGVEVLSAVTGRKYIWLKGSSSSEVVLADNNSEA